MTRPQSSKYPQSFILLKVNVMIDEKQLADQIAESIGAAQSNAAVVELCWHFKLLSIIYR